MEWSGFVFSRFFLRFLVVPGFGHKNQCLISIQKPSMFFVISQCSDGAPEAVFSLQDRRTG